LQLSLGLSPKVLNIEYKFVDINMTDTVIEIVMTIFSYFIVCIWNFKTYWSSFVSLGWSLIPFFILQNATMNIILINRLVNWYDWNCHWVQRFYESKSVTVANIIAVQNPKIIVRDMPPIKNIRKNWIINFLFLRRPLDLSQ